VRKTHNMSQYPSYRKLYRSRTDRPVTGVCGGLGEYFSIDPTLIRLAVVLAAIVTGGAAAIGYLIAAIVIPQAPIADPPTGQTN
jgi:phage shock protein C